MPGHDTSSFVLRDPALPGSSMDEFLRRKAVSENDGRITAENHMDRGTAAKKNGTSAETYGEPQTAAEPAKLSTAAHLAKQAATRLMARPESGFQSSNCSRSASPLVLSQHLGIPGRNRAPGKITLLRLSASLREYSPVGFIAKDAKQGGPKALVRCLGHQHDSGFGNRPAGLPTFARHYRQTASNSRNGASPP